MTDRSVMHLTSVHSALDTRILHRECRTLAEAGYRVQLVAPGDNDTMVHGVRIRAVPRAGNRFIRMTRTVWEVYQTARADAAAVYHLHDPELLPIGRLLSGHGARVVYDVHEDVPRQVLSKYWIKPWMRGPLSSGVSLGEAGLSRGFDGIVAATPGIAERFPGDRTVTVQNFPRLDELESPGARPLAEREPLVVYVGGIGVTRGALEMVRSMAKTRTECRLVLAGRILPASLEDELRRQPGAGRVEFAGWLDRGAVRTLLGRARVGLVTLHPTPSYVESYPVKLFEYMAAGLPVVASDFPLWRAIVEEAGCGLTVDPLRPDAIAEAVDRLLTDHSLAAEMGRRGRAAVEARYHWGTQADKLLALYARLTS